MDGGNADHAGAVICRTAGDNTRQCWHLRNRTRVIARSAGSYSLLQGVEGPVSGAYCVAGVSSVAVGPSTICTMAMGAESPGRGASFRIRR